ncbi:MAG: hypothetical protein AAF585_14790 [Verrucomicrobiota bacterium]
MSTESIICAIACPLAALWLMVAPPIINYALNKRKERMRKHIADDAHEIAAQEFPHADREVAAAILTMIWSATGIPLRKMKSDSKLGADLALTDFDGMDFEKEVEETFGVRLPQIGRYDLLRDLVDYINRNLVKPVGETEGPE